MHKGENIAVGYNWQSHPTCRTFACGNPKASYNPKIKAQIAMEKAARDAQSQLLAGGHFLTAQGGGQVAILPSANASSSFTTDDLSYPSLDESFFERKLTFEELGDAQLRYYFDDSTRELIWEGTDATNPDEPWVSTRPPLLSFLLRYGIAANSPILNPSHPAYRLSTTNNVLGFPSQFKHGQLEPAWACAQSHPC